MRAQAGQSTLEYVALVLLALVVLAAGVAAASAAGLAQILAAQFARAICVAAAGDCDRDRAPCVVASRSRSADASLRVWLVRLAGGRTVLRERRSDGSELVTLVDRSGAGLEAAVGAELGVGTHQFGATLTGGASGRLARARTWRVRGPAEAEELLRRIAAAVPVRTAGRTRPLRRQGRPPPPPPPPDITFGERGMDAEVRGQLGVLGLRFDAEDLFGTSLDRASGERSFTIRRRNDLAGSVGLGAGAQGEGLARGEERYTLTVDAAGRPLDLAITETRRVQAGAALPGALRRILRRPPAPLHRGRIVQLERHLDLTNAASLAVAGAFIRAVRSPRLRLGDAVAVSRALRVRLDAAGTALERVYDLQASTTGLRGSVSAGPGLGGGVEHSVESARLVAATARGLDGSWRERGDCLRAARRV
ncbi:MAG TPA: hypothetical protein VMT10_13675 [Solirubrobacteraceae bacterium]|nr:hypothetical protein [Solirubrobacteraceae bacterium]